MNLNVVNTGLLSYGEALEIQKQLAQKRAKGEIDHTLLLLEHPSVLTMGVRGEYNHIYRSAEELKKQGVDIFEVDRGGDVTYHGPGQIVGYPIFDLNDFDRDLRRYIQKIQQCIIDLLEKEYGIDARGEFGKYTGVWVGEEKIMAIGVSVKKWITMHGFAFNINTNLEHFNWINPCGLSKGVTSVEKITGCKQEMTGLFEKVAAYFAKEFDLCAVPKSLQELL